MVVYENKRTARPDKELFSSQFLEGVVWSRVQVKDVSTICLENSVLPWEEFVEYLRVDLMRQRVDLFPAVDSYDTLRKLGAAVNPPECKEYTVKLETMSFRDHPGDADVRRVQTPFRSVVALTVELDDAEIMYQKLKRQLNNYMWVLHRNRMMEGFSLTFTTDETALLGPLVELLNADTECTDKGRRHVCSEPHYLHFVEPYPGTETK